MNMNNNLFISNIYLGSENFDNFGILLFKIRIRKFILYHINSYNKIQFINRRNN